MCEYTHTHTHISQSDDKTYYSHNEIFEFYVKYYEINIAITFETIQREINCY